MCGIAGFVDKRNLYSTGEKRQLAAVMLASIKHRGPDGEGIHIEKNVALAQARLSIVDVSSAGLQPMWNEDKTCAITVNGEVYNHPSLRSVFEKKYTFRSRSDSETLLYSYVEWKERCLEKIKGMYAFSILDIPQNKLFFGVDRFSMKPLYYVDTPDWFAWSSEVKALLQLPGVKALVNENVIGEQLMFRSVAGRETLFNGIYKMTPGEAMSFSLSSNTRTSYVYWSPTYTGNVPEPGDIERLLKKSVQEHLLSDVPLGVQLSGGLDSSLISALVREVKQDTKELHSFSIGLSQAEWNEFPYSRQASSELSTTHHELLFSEQDFCDALPLATYHHDEPINHSHSIPMMFLAREAKRNVTVLLSGEGADEIFSGYLRYLPLLKNKSVSQRDLLFSNAFSSEEKVRAVAPDTKLLLTNRTAYLDEVKNSPVFFQIAYYDVKTYLTTLLVRQDKMGMRFGLENRVPFLDHELVDATLQLPLEKRIYDEQLKSELKAIAEAYLPQEIIFRKKVGFGQPLAEWFRNPSGLGRYLDWFKETSTRKSLDYGAIQRLISQHVSGEVNHVDILWPLVNLELWARIFIDGRSSDDIASSLSGRK
jgi:asparagine synthase (glutamine-hydrolysing)